MKEYAETKEAHEFKHVEVDYAQLPVSSNVGHWGRPGYERPKGPMRASR